MALVNVKFPDVVTGEFVIVNSVGADIPTLVTVPTPPPPPLPAATHPNKWVVVLYERAFEPVQLDKVVQFISLVEDETAT